MAHNINYNEQTGKHSFFSVKEKAWHNLGQIISDYPTSAEAIKHAGLNYHVEKRPLFTYDTENFTGDPDTDIIIPEIEVPDFFATVRTDTDEILGVVGNDYEVVQNVNAFDFFDAIVGGKDGILYETAGALGKGERIFITAKLPDYIRIGRDDLIEQYLFLTTSHDGYGSITAAFTPIRIVCQNTLNAALRNHSHSIKIRHTASAVDRLKQAHQLLGVTNLLANELEEVFNNWSKIRITDNAVKRLIQVAMAPNKEVLQNLQNGKIDELSTNYNNMVSSVMEYALINPTQQEVTTKGTLFGAYNAVTGYFQNVRNYKDDESKFKSIMYGTGLQRSQTAFDLCKEFSKHGIEVLN
ncbi:MAG: alpha/beta hydrolase [Mucilaginibacter sp.]|nr:alpha/beta hydrolase [Mucilaginibacter sp.]